MTGNRSLVRSPILAAVALSIAAAFTIPAIVAAQAGASVSSPDLANVRRYLRSLTTLTANFSQTDRTGRVLTGTLSLKQPGRIRFQYEKGVPLLIVAEGGALTFIDYSVRQVQRWPIRNSPLGILLDPARDLTRFAKIVPGARQVVSVEARDPGHPEYGRITLVFARRPDAPAGLALQGWVALDSQNNRTTVRLTNQRHGAPVSDGTFRWNDPRKSTPRS